MKRANNSAVVLVVASLGAIAIGAVVWRQFGDPGNGQLVVAPAAPRIDSRSTVPSVIPSAAEDAVAASPPPVASVPEMTEKTEKSVAIQPAVTANAPRKKTSTPPTAVGPDIPADDRPVARQALSLVGADPAAETVWTQAINDPNTSAHDRKDLIEDLNEDGFPDPHHITADDLPLIENRLALIERLAPQSTDDVNTAAFAEAYKDLVNMRSKAMNQ